VSHANSTHGLSSLQFQAACLMVPISACHRMAGTSTSTSESRDSANKITKACTKAATLQVNIALLSGR
jgi:hypothetical protein